MTDGQPYADLGLGEVLDVQSITVRYVGILRNALDKQQETVDLPEQTTVRVLLGILAERNGAAFCTAVFAADGNLRPLTTVLLDGIDMEQTGGLDSSIRGGEKVSLLLLEQPFTGG